MTNSTSSYVLECKEGGDFKPHPEGIHPAVCVDLIDLGLVKTEFQGVERMVNKLKLVFETEEKTDDGKNCTISKNFTASLHPKAKLAEFLGKWRGRPVVPGESIDLGKLIGACCTLVVSHQQNLVGRTYANIDAISKPTKKLAPSGGYDGAAARKRITEWKARQGTGVPATAAAPRQAGPAPTAAAPRHGTSVPANKVAPGVAPAVTGGAPVLPKSSAPASAQSEAEDNVPFDPEVGF